MRVFLLLVLGVSCILPVCSGLPFKLPFSNISLCFCLSKKKVSYLVLGLKFNIEWHTGMNRRSLLINQHY